MRLRFSVATLRAILHLILTLVTFGLWGFVWIGVIALASEKRMSVGIDEWGNTNVQKALALTSVEQRKRKGSLRIALRYMNFAPGGIAGDGPVWSPDGAEIVYSTYELELLFTNLKGELLRAFVAPYSLSFLPGTLDWQAAVPPANRTVPTISGGDFEVGEQALATTGTWFATPPLTLDIQWQRCLTSGGRERCSDIPRASSETYTIGTRDRCRRLRVVVTASNSLGSATAISEPTPRIGPLGNCA